MEAFIKKFDVEFKKDYFWYVVFLAAFIFVFYPVLLDLIRVWANSSDYSHGFLIPPVVFYMVWQKRNKLRQITIKGSKIGFLMVIISFCLYIISLFGDILTLQPLSMVLFVGASVLCLFGYHIFIELLFPISILAFMLPIPAQILSALTIKLQLFVSMVSTSLMSLTGIAILREGNLIHLQEKTLQVVAACSGMRSMVSLLALSAILGYFTLRTTTLRAILFLSAIPLAVLVNIVRITLMIIFISYLGIDLSQGALHSYFGLFIFIIALLSLFILRWILAKWDIASEHA